MSVALHELFRLSSETAARVSSQLVHGACASAALLDDLARAQRRCLDAMHTRLRQKASILDLNSAFTSRFRVPSPAFVCDFSDIDQCMRYTVKCCEECCGPEQMRQLVPILRCLQCDSPNNSVLMPLFVQMGGLVAVLSWAKRTAVQLNMHMDGHSMAVLTGILQIVSKFHVLPKQTIPSGACKLLLDIMGLRLPPISTCVVTILRCWMKCAERHASATTRDSISAPSKPKVASPGARSATWLQVNQTAASVCNVVVPSSAARSADCGATCSHKVVAELCEDEDKVENVVHQSKRRCDTSRLPAPSRRLTTSAVCDALSFPSQHPHASSLSSIRQSTPNQSASSSLINSLDFGRSQSIHQHDAAFLAHQHSGFSPAAFDVEAAVHALDSLASILQQDASSVFTCGERSQLPFQSQDFKHHDAAASVEQGFTELFAPPSTEDGDFFLTDDQFFADDVTMSSDAINRAFIAALRDFSQRDELSGLQSLCARFRS